MFLTDFDENLTKFTKQCRQFYARYICLSCYYYQITPGRSFINWTITMNLSPNITCVARSSFLELIRYRASILSTY